MEIGKAETTGDFLRCALRIGLPVVMQSMISSLINTLDVFMLGQLGEVTITAASVCNQWFLLYCILANGIAAAAAIFIAQYWGSWLWRRESGILRSGGDNLYCFRENG